MENEKIKIVVTALVPKSANRIGKTGGVSRLVEVLKRTHSLHGARIILVSSDQSYAEYFSQNNITARFIHIKSNFKYKSLVGLCLKSLLIIIKSLFVLKLDFLDGKDEKVVIYSSSDLFWEAIPAFFFKTRKKNIEWIQVIHHIYPSWKKRLGSKLVNFFGYYLQRFSFFLIKIKADKIIVVNESIEKDLAKLGLDKQSIYLNSNGIDFSYFSNLSSNGVSYDGVFLGRLNYSKGIFELIDIWENVCQNNHKARLAMIGRGDKNTIKLLENKIKYKGLDKNIELLGFLPDNEAHPILKSSKVFVFPSHEEGWGIAIAEAMACGLPVVSWDLPVYKSVFEDYTIQIEENDIKKFSDAIINLLGDGKSRREIGEKNREFIKKYSWDKVAEKEWEIISSS